MGIMDMKWTPAGRFLSSSFFLGLLWFGLGSAGCASRGGAPTPSPEERAVWLLTPEEIERLEREPGGERTRGPDICEEPGSRSDRGPQIELIEPEVTGGSITAPFPVHIRLISRGSPIDRDSLRVTVRYQLPLGLVKSVDITDRVKPDWERSIIDQPELEARPGCYQIQLSVADDRGRESFLIQGFRVKRS
jgi:hypothetical protein